MQRSDIMCPVCKKGKTYYDSGREATFCDNSNCEFILSIEDVIRGKSKTDLLEIPKNVLRELINEGKIPKRSLVSKNEDTYESTAVCQNCGVVKTIHIPRGTLVSEYTPGGICDNCGCEFVNQKERARDKIYTDGQRFVR